MTDLPNNDPPRLDLNLDGLSLLKALRSEGLGGDSRSASMFGEVRQLMARERETGRKLVVEQMGERLFQEINFAFTQEYPLPSWARPVLQRAKHACDCGADESSSIGDVLDAVAGITEAIMNLTPAQRAEIERDDG